MEFWFGGGGVAQMRRRADVVFRRGGTATYTDTSRRARARRLNTSDHAKHRQISTSELIVL